MTTANRMLLAASLAALAACATDQTALAPEVPESIRVSDKVALSQQVPASGVQIYDCQESKADPKKLEWVFRAPEAQLFDKSGRQIGKHYGGPTWEANDGSKVVAEVKGRDDGPDSNAIPWLLLVSKSNTGIGAFSKVQSIQRVNTVGGKAPAGACDQAGRELRVPYKAVYYLYVPAQ